MGARSQAGFARLPFHAVPFAPSRTRRRWRWTWKDDGFFCFFLAAARETGEKCGSAFARPPPPRSNEFASNRLAPGLRLSRSIQISRRWFRGQHSPSLNWRYSPPPLTLCGFIKLSLGCRVFEFLALDFERPDTWLARLVCTLTRLNLLDTGWRFKCQDVLNALIPKSAESSNLNGLVAFLSGTWWEC